MPIDPYRFLDFATRKIIQAWVDREPLHRPPIPWAAMTKPLARTTVALVTTAGVAQNEDRPFDQEGERQNPWWGDPTHRLVPRGTTERDVKLYHLHIDTRFAEQDLDVVLPLRRLDELVERGVVGGAASEHYSIMGYQLRPEVVEQETAPALLAHMQRSGVEAVALIPA